MLSLRLPFVGIVQTLDTMFSEWKRYKSQLDEKHKFEAHIRAFLFDHESESESMLVQARLAGTE